MAVPGKRDQEQLSLARISIGSDEDFKVYCQPCDRDGPRLPAHGYCTNCTEHLCETCFTFHKRHTMSRHHTLQDSASMPKTMSPPTKTQSENLANLCTKHKIEMIKFYCRDHKALLCNVCVTLEHTSCKVNYIPDISGQVIDGKEYQEIQKAIKEMNEECSRIMQSVTENSSKSNKSLTYALEDLNKFQTEVNQRLDEWKAKIEEAAQTIQDENSKNLVTTEAVNDDITKSLKTSLEQIEHLNATKQANDLFIELKHAEEMLEDQKKVIAHLTSYDIKKYNFQPDAEISSLLRKEWSVGSLTGKSLKPASFSQIKQGSNKDEICIKTSQDNSDCWITGMAFLTSDLLIITDEANKAVKMFDVKTKSVLDHQVQDCSPWDVATIAKDTIAVTLTDNKVIQFLSVIGNKLAKKSYLMVDGECLGISYKQDILVVSFTNPAQVQVLLIDGTVLQTIKGDNMFRYPSYVTTNEMFMYVSDPAMKKTVIKLNWQGDVKSKYYCTAKPRGSTISDDGHVFVCNICDSAIGEVEDRITTICSIKNPQAICWCSKRRALFISCLDELQENANYIKIINMS